MFCKMFDKVLAYIFHFFCVNFWEVSNNCLTSCNIKPTIHVALCFCNYFIV